MDLTEFFTAIGWVLLLVGGGWCVLVASTASSTSSMALFGVLIAMLPGFSVVGSGLIFLAIGGVLARLDRIARSVADTADATEGLLAHVRGQVQ
jgi:hypothetical protein